MAAEILPKGVVGVNGKEFPALILIFVPFFRDELSR